MTAALQAGDIDTNDGFSIAGSPQLVTGGFNVISLKASYHRELSMRTDMAPFNNKYVRQAIAYTLNRPAIVQALFKGFAGVGNDSPFAPAFPATVGPPAVPQRARNLKLAKELLAKGGVPNGFSTPLLTETLGELPHFAQIIKQSASQIGVDINLTVETSSKYYGQAVFGKSDWAGREDEPGRLRRPRRAEHLPPGTPAVPQRQDRPRGLERRPVQQRHLRQAPQGVHRPPRT